MADKVYELQELHKDPRSGETFPTTFDNYATLADAKRAAKQLHSKWVIVESKIVARSDD